jgi:endonuclease/exonuclease/phosphatase family metal-dependent hydrolase
MTGKAASLDPNTLEEIHADVEAPQTVSGIVAEHREQLLAQQERAHEATRLEAEIRSLQQDLERQRKRHGQFVALGKRHVEIPWRHVHPGFGMELEMEPLRSKLTGDELAAKVGASIAHLETEIGNREAEIERLLGA